MNQTELTREGFRVAKPALDAIADGTLYFPPDMRANKLWLRGQSDISEFVAKFAELVGGHNVRAGIEKAGVVVCDTVVFKLGIRSSIEPKLYDTSPSYKRQLMACTVSLNPWLSVMERVLPLANLQPEEMISLQSTENWHDRLSEVRSSFPDAHDANVGLHPDGRIVMLDYSIDHQPDGESK